MAEDTKLWLKPISRRKFLALSAAAGRCGSFDNPDVGEKGQGRRQRCYQCDRGNYYPHQLRA